MSGSSGGTGRPMWFRCSRCRSSRRDGRGTRVTLTGREKPAPIGSARGRNSATLREYRCDDCGHVGWSRHTDLERQARK